MNVRPGALVSLLLFAACGPKTVPENGGGGGGGGTGTPIDRPDAAPAGPPVEGPAPGSEGDVLGRIFEGSEPAVPKVFGGLRPGMTRAEATKARPSAWGNDWELTLPDEPGVTVGATIGESPAVVESLSVAFEQVAAAKRLELAWGPADATAFNANTVCWLAPSAKLKACYVEAIDRHAIELGAYRPLEDAIGKGGRRALPDLAKHLGATKQDVAKAFPEGVELSDPNDRSLHRIEVKMPPTEYSADTRPDRLLFFLDAKAQVREVAIRFGANDPKLRPALVEAVRAAAKPLTGVAVTVVEDEPVDVVVLLDREEGLR
jgi:hypothetical protein